MNFEEGFEFLMSYDDAPDALAALRVRENGVVHLGDGASLGLHLLSMIQGDTDHFALRNHRRQDGKPLKFFSAVAKSYFDLAKAGYHQGSHYAILDADHLARMVCICDRLTPVVQSANLERVREDKDLILLLQRQRMPEWAEAENVAREFPDLFTNGHRFGGYTVFYDLARLIWVHELAHVVLGHAEIWSEFVDANGLPEIDVSRDEVWSLKIGDVPWPIALQSFELQADQFAINFITKQILYGWDPAGAIAGPEIDVIQRLGILAIACATFAVDIQLSQGPRDAARENHPSAMLRYMTMIHTMLESTHDHEAKNLGGRVNLAAFRAVEGLARAVPIFHELLSVTPLLAETPQYKELCREQDVLMTHVGGMLAEIRLEHTYFPTT